MILLYARFQHFSDKPGSVVDKDAHDVFS